MDGIELYGVNDTVRGLRGGGTPTSKRVGWGITIAVKSRSILAGSPAEKMRASLD